MTLMFEAYQAGIPGFTVPQPNSLGLENPEVFESEMLAAGFTNYPAEWWHWSYGDQAWAYRGGHEAACYGAVEPDGTSAFDLAFKIRDDPGLE